MNLAKLLILFLILFPLLGYSQEEPQQPPVIEPLPSTPIDQPSDELDYPIVTDEDYPFSDWDAPRLEDN